MSGTTIGPIQSPDRHDLLQLVPEPGQRRVVLGADEQEGGLGARSVDVDDDGRGRLLARRDGKRHRPDARAPGARGGHEERREVVALDASPPDGVEALAAAGQLRGKDPGDAGGLQDDAARRLVAAHVALLGRLVAEARAPEETARQALAVAPDRDVHRDEAARRREAQRLLGLEPGPVGEREAQLRGPRPLDGQRLRRGEEERLAQLRVDRGVAGLDVERPRFPRPARAPSPRVGPARPCWCARVHETRRAPLFVNATVYSGAVTSTRRSRSSATDVRAALADAAGAGRRPVASAERAGAASAGGLRRRGRRPRRPKGPAHPVSPARPPARKAGCRR